METLIESTRDFEIDLGRLSAVDRDATIEKINTCVRQYLTQPSNIDPAFHQPRLSSDIQGYDSSLYAFQVLPTLSVILSIDEDPIFGQVIFTLFRAIAPERSDYTYREVAASLYQELKPSDRKPAQVAA
jgi:hypothetical protein